MSVVAGFGLGVICTCARSLTATPAAAATATATATPPAATTTTTTTTTDPAPRVFKQLPVQTRMQRRRAVRMGAIAGQGSVSWHKQENTQNKRAGNWKESDQTWS